MRAITVAGHRAQGSQVKLSEAVADALSLTPIETVSSQATPADQRAAAQPTTGAVDIGRRVPTVLLIDDDHAWRDELSRYIRANGFNSLELDDFPALVAWVRSSGGAYVVVTDLTVGTRHLFDSIAEISAERGAAVLVLSRHRDDTETIVALELGADDVIDKGIDRRQILARIRAAARRLLAFECGLRRGTTDTSPGAIQDAAAWRFLPNRRELIDPAGRPVLLTAAEFKLLDTFVAHAGRPLHRSDLSALVLGRQHGPRDRGIDNLVAKLRRKLGESAKLPHMIKTARPFGYVFTGFGTATESLQQALRHSGQIPAVRSPPGQAIKRM